MGRKARILLTSLVLATSVPNLGLAATDDERLIQAVRNQEPELVRELVAQGVDINGAQGDGTTALHWAAHRDDLAIVDLLIRSDATVNATNDLGATPLHVACQNRSGSMIERLLAAGADANATLLNGETVLMSCSRTGDALSVAALLAHDAQVNEAESGHDQTALMWAAAQGHPAVVRLLLEAGADVRARSITYPQTVVDEETQRAGREELNYTVLRGGSTPLLFAARNGGVASARLLLEAGAGPNDSLSSGMSALVLAAHSGHSDVGIVLLEAGANPNNIGLGYTALHAAVLRNRLDLVEALLAHRADPNIRMTRGTPMRRQTTDFNLPKTLVGATPYFLAARFVEADIMRALAAEGADPHLAMDDGTTPLMAAVGMGSRRGNRRGISAIDVGGGAATETQVLEAVVAAVDLGGDVNAANLNGDRALHVAAANEHASVVQFLVDRGAAINARNRRDLTPLGVLTRPARGRGQAAAAAANDGDPAESAETVQLLRRLGATQ